MEEDAFATSLRRWYPGGFSPGQPSPTFRWHVEGGVEITRRFNPGETDQRPNFTQLFPSDIRNGTAVGTIEASVGATTLKLTSAGVTAKRLDPGKYRVIVKDTSSKVAFSLKGPGVNKRTGKAQKGTVIWNVTLSPGRYTYASSTGKRGSFKVS